MNQKLPKDFEWTPQLAYIIGLLVTDGNLSNDGRHIIMRSSDIDLLETFRDCLSLENKISISKNNGFAKKPSLRIQFGDVQFYRWLLDIGLHPNKTHTIGEIKIPDEYFIDFLRGHLDGDGSIFHYQDKYDSYRGRTYTNQRVYIKFISVSQKHIEWLHKKIQDLVGVKGSLSFTIPTTHNRVPMWTIKFAKKESLKLIPLLYYKEDLPSLQRKAEIAKRILEIARSEKRHKYSRIESTPIPVPNH